jgi:hypothetical protein
MQYNLYLYIVIISSFVITDSFSTDPRHRRGVVSFVYTFLRKYIYFFFILADLIVLKYSSPTYLFALCKFFTGGLLLKYGGTVGSCFSKSCNLCCATACDKINVQRHCNP